MGHLNHTKSVSGSKHFYHGTAEAGQAAVFGNCATSEHFMYIVPKKILLCRLCKAHPKLCNGLIND